MELAQRDGRGKVVLATGDKIRMKRESKGMSRPVLAGLVGRSPDWLKKIEAGTRPLNSFSMLVELARVLGVHDLAELTGADLAASSGAWSGDSHHVVPGVRKAMRDVSFNATSACSPGAVLSGEELASRVRGLWLIWHRAANQRTEVGMQLPTLLRHAHASIRGSEGPPRRRCLAATADLYRLVQRLLAHICEPELHALAVERGRALSEEADLPLSIAQAAWSSSVGLCAAGHHEEAAQLADGAIADLQRFRTTAAANEASDATGTIGALQLEAAAAYGLAGREGDAYRYLDAAARTASDMPAGGWHLPSAFEKTNVEILSVIVGVSLRHPREAIAHAQRIDLGGSPSLVRRSRLLLEQAQAHADRRELTGAVRALKASVGLSAEAVALIPWARTLADELAHQAPRSVRDDAVWIRSLMSAIH